jgi:aldehyde:ferredoxin oxidoreductase
MERDFNRAAGMTAADDRLPAYFMTEVLSPRGTVFDVPEAELDAMWN